MPISTFDPHPADDPSLREQLRKALWSPERAHKYMKRFGVIRGCNYVPAYGHSHAHMWYDFREDVINRELDWAQEMTINSLRMFVPIYGVHGGQWYYPGAVYYGNHWPHVKPLFREFWQAFIGRYAHDQRIVAWDMVNEAQPRDRAMLEYSFACAREINPSQPLTSCWQAGDISDIFTFHTYGQPGLPTPHDSQGSFDREVELAVASGRPALCTEFMARNFGNTLASTLPFFAKHRIGWYFWGLCAGSAQYHFPWNWPEGSPAPKVWFHCVLYPDGTPYDATELALIRSFKWRD